MPKLTIMCGELRRPQLVRRELLKARLVGMRHPIRFARAALRGRRGSRHAVEATTGAPTMKKGTLPQATCKPQSHMCHFRIKNNHIAPWRSRGCHVDLFNVSKPVRMDRNRDSDPPHLLGNESASVCVNWSTVPYWHPKRRHTCKPLPDWKRARLSRTQNWDSARLSSTHLITRSSTTQIFPHHLLRLSTSPPPSE